MKKLFAGIFAVLFILCSSMAFADSSSKTASGNFNINTIAMGGGLDADGQLISHGAAGGISGAGGVVLGQASGEVATIKIFRHTFVGGTAGASLDTVGGGITKTEAYKFHSPGIKGVGSKSDSYAIAGAELKINATGIAGAEGTIIGAAGEGSLNGSVIGDGHHWKSDALSFGIAGQGAVGGFAGGAVTGFWGSSDIQGQVEMSGQSYSESYRGTSYNDGAKTETIGTNVGAFTEVNTIGYVKNCGLAFGGVEGGYIAAGGVESRTVQVTNGGFAAANAQGAYFGAGELGTSFYGSAVGGTQTSATTVHGYNGSIMSSSAAMQVTAGSVH